MTEKVQITIDGKTIDLAVMEATEGANVVDVRGLIAEGIYTYDPGFLSTAACDSNITYIDGEKGVLLYRGYPIEQLAAKSTHMEVCYLILTGELPTRTQLDEFVSDVKSHQAIDENLQRLFNGFNRDSHPMAVMTAATAGLAALYHEGLDITNAEHRRLAAIRLIAKVPTLAAMTYKLTQGEEFVAPDPDLDYAENFLNMCFGRKGKAPDASPTLAGAMDRIFILHADHEQNASTSTVRLAGSTESNPYTCMAAGMAALWGPAHGGANEAVLRMLAEIGCESRIEEYVNRAKDKDDPFKLMGFGHRVYKNFDPRATVLHESSKAVLNELGVENEPLLQIARQLEKIALEDQYFIERKLYPNVDFYSGITLKAIGIPTSMFTVIFAIGRTPGWIAHWDEMLSHPFKIGRPRQLYRGPGPREYSSINDR